MVAASAIRGRSRRSAEPSRMRQSELGQPTGRAAVRHECSGCRRAWATVMPAGPDYSFLYRPKVALHQAISPPEEQKSVIA
jgi:hypothetical protein